MLNKAMIATPPIHTKLTIFNPNQERIIATGKITLVLIVMSVKPNKQIVLVTNIVLTKVESNKTVDTQNNVSIHELTAL